MGGRRMEAACCPLLAPLLCFCFPSFKAGFVCVEDAWKRRVSYANRAAPPCQPGVRVLGVSARRIPPVDVRSVLPQVRRAFMVTDSFHPGRPFTLKSPFASSKSSLDSFSSSPLAAAVDSSAQESPRQRSHPLKPASRRRGPAAQRDFLRGLQG